MTVLFILLSAGVGDILVNAGIVAKVVLTILTVLSVISWAIAIDKMRTLKRVGRQNGSVLRLLPRDLSIVDSITVARRFPDAGLSKLLSEASGTVDSEITAIRAVEASHAPVIAKACRSAMERRALELVEKMESNLGILATTASVSPFLGLFGTVWGVMNSFLSMGQMGSASISVVGSGVAEALITTVFGLGAAIPALVAYNYLVNRIRRETSQMEAFVSRVADAIEKEILRELDSAKVSV
jgi:biopolymer transport protein TolQ